MQMLSRKCCFKCICILSQRAFYSQSAFYPWSAACSPQSAFYTDRFTNISTTDYNNKNCNEMVLRKMSLKSSSCLYYYVSLHVCKLNC